MMRVALFVSLALALQVLSRGQTYEIARFLDTVTFSPPTSPQAATALFAFDDNFGTVATLSWGESMDLALPLVEDCSAPLIQAVEVSPLDVPGFWSLQVLYLDPVTAQFVSLGTVSQGSSSAIIFQASQPVRTRLLRFSTSIITQARLRDVQVRARAAEIGISPTAHSWFAASPLPPTMRLSIGFQDFSGSLDAAIGLIQVGGIAGCSGFALDPLSTFYLFGWNFNISGRSGGWGVTTPSDPSAVGAQLYFQMAGFRLAANSLTWSRVVPLKL